MGGPRRADRRDHHGAGVVTHCVENVTEPVVPRREPAGERVLDVALDAAAFERAFAELRAAR